jgi:transcriptional regulator with XRE-family HTH domain
MSEHTPQAALARNLRRLRVARRWSLADLAAATGTGKATLSAIENGHANPTVGTLAGLASALEVDVAALLEGMPADQVTVVRSSGHDAGMERVGALGGDGEIQRAVFEPGSEVELPARSAGSRGHVLVTRGTLVAGPAERIVELGTGDYMAFPADRPHVFRTARRGAAAVLVFEG